MSHTPHDIGIAGQIGPYSDAVETESGLRWLHSAGTPGLAPDGTLPEDIAEQSRQAWENIVAVLAKAGMGLEDVVKVTTTLTRAEFIAPYAKVRTSFLKELRPAFMLSIVDRLVRPEMHVEVEVIAARR